jgi:biopolymer transport protein TolQ
MLFAGAATGARLAALDMWSLIWQASWIVQLVMLMLVVMSVVSWAIIFVKWRELRRAEQDSEAFLEVYQEGSLDAAYQVARDLDHSPLASIFLSAYGEMNRMVRHSEGSISESQGKALSRHIGWATSREGLRIEKGLPFLATTGSAAPFIGLFGTVIGIINSFQGIGAAGSASLAVVAPGIAEALIATAMGLVAAIPATIFYNYFVGELRGLTAAIDLFAVDCESDLLRHGSRPGAKV